MYKLYGDDDEGYTTILNFLHVPANTYKIRVHHSLCARSLHCNAIRHAAFNVNVINRMSLWLVDIICFHILPAERDQREKVSEREVKKERRHRTAAV